MASLWFIFALSAAILWGIGYVIDEQIMMQGISPSTLLLLHLIVIFPAYSFICWKYASFNQEVSTILDSKTLIFYVFISSIAIMGGNLLILMSVAEKNASLASIIEMSYPLFVILFSWLFFKNVHIDMWTGIGGFLIFSGVTIIYMKA